MSIAEVASSKVRASATGTTILEITLGAAVAEGDTIDVTLMNKSTESADIIGMEDQLNGEWPAPVVGPVHSGGTTFSHWRAVFEGSAAGTPVIEIEFDESINSEGTAVGLHGTTGTPVVDVIGTTYNSPGAAEDIPDTAAVSATAAGMLVEGITVNVYQATPPTESGGASVGPASTADGRVFTATRVITGAGSEDCSFDPASNTRWIVSQLTYIEASAGGSIVPLLNHLRQMKQ